MPPEEGQRCQVCCGKLSTLSCYSSTVHHLAGSNRSFTAYVFKRLDPPGQTFTGSDKSLLSTLLTAPRLLQASLPRLLRRRKPTAAYITNDIPCEVAKSKSKAAPRGRVALVDTMPHLRASMMQATDAADQQAANTFQRSEASQDAQTAATAGQTREIRPSNKPGPDRPTTGTNAASDLAEETARGPEQAHSEPKLTVQGRKDSKATATSMAGKLHGSNSTDLPVGKERLPCAGVENKALVAKPAFQRAKGALYTFVHVPCKV